jgi:3D (Asp-Asp-Asp) domain-containing protein
LHNSYTLSILSSLLFAIATTAQSAPLETAAKHPPPGVIVNVAEILGTKPVEQPWEAEEILGEEYKVTGYCKCAKCCGRWAYYQGGGWTSLHTRATPGHTAAVDPKVIPLGSRLWVEGIGVLVAEDTGSAIKGKRVDVFFATHLEAEQFGVQRRKVMILQ